MDRMHALGIARFETIGSAHRSVQQSFGSGRWVHRGVHGSFYLRVVLEPDYVHCRVSFCNLATSASFDWRVATFRM